MTEVDFLNEWLASLVERKADLLRRMLDNPEWSEEQRGLWRLEAEDLLEEHSVFRAYGEAVLAGSDAQVVEFRNADVTSVDGVPVDLIREVNER